jgi:hypothetical protein
MAKKSAELKLAVAAAQLAVAAAQIAAAAALTAATKTSAEKAAPEADTKKP